MNITDCTFYPAYLARTDLNRFGHNSLLLFALQLRFGIEDIVSVGSTSITDSSDDKKIDMIYIDEDEKMAVIAQSYIADDLEKKEAKANKAADLNTGISWILNRSIDELPDSLKSHADELRHLIMDNKIETFYAWYVHNLSESNNVKQEMLTVERTIHSAIRTNYPNISLENIFAIEIGFNTIEEWYKSILTPILVNDTFDIEIPGGYKLAQKDWEGFVTAIKASWLYDHYKKYGKELFSANIREYLGSRKSDTNINNGIKNSAENEPDYFWVYNNGITALTHNFTPHKKRGKEYLRLEGISIVNGAQTTGAIGSLNNSPASSATVPIRIIKCTNVDTIYGIVRYNNSQNKITAPDFRSNDSIQRRLKIEFDEIPAIEYSARRGGQEDAIKQRPYLLSSVTAGQALAALNNNPDIAYHKKNKIWEDDALYSRYFNDFTNAYNILFAYSLLKAIENKKIELLSKIKSGELTESENIQLQFFRKRGSILMFMAALSKSLEVILERALPNKSSLRFRKNISLTEATKFWEPIINIANPFVNSLSEGLADGFRNATAVNNAIRTFVTLIEATKQVNRMIFDEFKKNVS